MRKKCKPFYRAAQAGFTLFELMVVTILSAISITFIYYMFIQNSQLFLVQEEVAKAQSALRFATARLQEDIRRAGFMGILSPTDPRLCISWSVSSTNPTGFEAIFSDNANTNDATTSDGNSVQPDRLFLLGNYASADFYSAQIIADNKIKLDTVPDAGLFARLFPPNQLLRITGNNGKIQIVQIGPNAQDADSSTGTLNLRSTGPLVLRRSANCGTSYSIRVNPLHRIRYRIHGIAESAANYEWRLVREPLTPSCGASIANCSWSPQTNHTVVLARNIVDLQFWFAWNSTSGLVGYDPRESDTSKARHRAHLSDDNCPILLASTGGCSTNPEQTILNNIMRLRSVFFRISIRSENEDPGYAFRNRASDGGVSTQYPLLSFELTPKRGSAWVRSIASQAQLLNFTP